MATSLARRAWVFALCLALHNADELLGDLPGWVAAQPALATMAWLQAGGWFVPAAIGLLFAVVGFALWAQLAPHPWMGLILKAAAALMLANVLSHIVLSFLVGSIMPGTVTALAVLAPVCLWLLLAQDKKNPGRAGVQKS